MPETSVIGRIARSTEPLDGHLIWRGATGAAGPGTAVGKIYLGPRGSKKQLSAHRVLWQIEYGQEPTTKMYPLCSVRLCVEPSHWTTQSPETDRRGTCKSCERVTRPIGTTLEEYPDTILHAGGQMCGSCKNSFVERLHPDLQQAVREIFPDDLHWYFGLGDEVA